METIDYLGKPTPVAEKDPDAVVDYGFLWEGYLGTDTITASEWIVENPSGDFQVVSNFFDATTTTVWVKGGDVGVRYQVTNRITTEQGRTDDRSMIIPIKGM